MAHNLRSRGNTAALSDNTLGENSGSNTGDTRAIQLSTQEYQEFRAFQSHRRQALLSFETQGQAKRHIPSLKTKDPKPYTGKSPEELEDYFYEYERHFNSKRFQKELDGQDLTPAERIIQEDETIQKVAYASSWLDDTPQTD